MKRARTAFTAPDRTTATGGTTLSSMMCLSTLHTIVSTHSYKGACAHICCTPPIWSNPSRSPPDIEALGPNGASVWTNFNMFPLSTGQSGAPATSVRSLTTQRKRTETGAKRSPRASKLATANGTTFVPLIMEADGGWSFPAQRYLNRLILEYRSCGMPCANASRLLWRRPIDCAAF